MKFRFGVLSLALVPGLVLADGVTRSVEQVAGGCKVTLAWEFTGKVESDLVIEERYVNGWTVDDSTVPFVSLDATWFSGPVARFAIKPALLANPGAISFTIVAGEGAVSGKPSGDWKMYLGGTLKTGVVGGTDAIVKQSFGSSVSGGTVVANAVTVEKAVAISSFRLVAGGCELSYTVTCPGVLVVEGCDGLGKDWRECKRVAVVAGDGATKLTAAEVGKCCFMRMKLLTEEN